MKRAYNKHVYSGHRVNPKRSRAGILRYHGSQMTGRRQAWRDASDNAQKIQTQPITSTDCDRSESTVSLRGFAVHSSKPNANLLPQKQKAPGLCTSTASITWPPQDPEVKNHEPTIKVEKESPPNFEGLDGYRIVDIKHVLNWAMNLQSDHSKECTFAKVKFVNEDRDGLSSVYIFECVTCDKKWHMCSEEKNKINKSFVWGTLTAASNYSQSAHMLAIMDIPSMSADKFKKVEIGEHSYKI